MVYRRLPRRVGATLLRSDPGIHARVARCDRHLSGPSTSTTYVKLSVSLVRLGTHHVWTRSLNVTRRVETTVHVFMGGSSAWPAPACDQFNDVARYEEMLAPDFMATLPDHRICDRGEFLDLIASPNPSRNRRATRPMRHITSGRGSRPTPRQVRAVRSRLDEDRRLRHRGQLWPKSRHRQSVSPKAPDLEKQAVSLQRPCGLRETGMPACHSPSTKSMPA